MERVNGESRSHNRCDVAGRMKAMKMNASYIVFVQPKLASDWSTNESAPIID